METWTLPDCSGSCLLMREFENRHLEIIHYYPKPRDKVEARVNSPVNVTAERVAVTITTLFPAAIMTVFQYASSSEKTICKLFLGIESDTWLMCHATPVCCTVFPRAAPWPLIGQCVARLASHWSRPSRQHALCLLETGTRLGQGKCFTVCVPEFNLFIC